MKVLTSIGLLFTTLVLLFGAFTATGQYPDSPKSTQTRPGSRRGVQAQRIMGSLDRQAVFATPINSRNGLFGKWTQIKLFSKGDLLDAPSGSVSRRILTETDLIDMSEGSLTVIPLIYQDELFCFGDSQAEKPQCYQLAEYGRGLAIIEPNARPGSRFEVIAHLTVLEDQGTPLPSEAVLAKARAERAVWVQNRKAALAKARAEQELLVQKREEKRRSNGFKVDGLQNAQLYVDLHDGQFESISLTPNDFLFAKILHQYVWNFAVRCSNQVSIPDRVELTRSDCQVMRVTERDGAPISRVCVESLDINLGIYADRELHSLARQLVRDSSFQIIADQMLTSPQGQGPGPIVADAIERFKAALAATSLAATDMAAFFTQNSCTSPGLKQFEDNLRRFAKNEPPLLP